MRWPPLIFKRTACICQTATRWDVPLYHITLWMINDEMLIFVYLLDELIVSFCHSNLTRKTGGLELASTITLVIQANQLTKCASHPETLKVRSHPKIFKFLYWLFGHVAKWLDKKDKVNLKSYDVTTWLKSNCNTISREVKAIRKWKLVS